jgi:site-specific recombinase XerD
LEFFITKRLKECKSSTVRNEINRITDFFEYARKNKFIKSNPCLDIEKPKREKEQVEIFTSDELTQFLDNIDNNKSISYYSGLYLVMLLSGIRIGETLALKWTREINLKKGIKHSQDLEIKIRLEKY